LQRKVGPRSLTVRKEQRWGLGLSSSYRRKRKRDNNVHKTDSMPPGSKDLLVGKPSSGSKELGKKVLGHVKKEGEATPGVLPKNHEDLGKYKDRIIGTGGIKKSFLLRERKEELVKFAFLIMKSRKREGVGNLARCLCSELSGHNDIESLEEGKDPLKAERHLSSWWLRNGSPTGMTRPVKRN